MALNKLLADSEAREIDRFYAGQKRWIRFSPPRFAEVSTVLDRDARRSKPRPVFGSPAELHKALLQAIVGRV